MAADEPPEVPSPGGGAASASGLSGERSPWWIYCGNGRPLPDGEFAAALPPPPPWRTFDGGPPLAPPPADERDLRRRLGPVTGARSRLADPGEVDAVNAALLLRRPLLVTGEPGVGKSTLAHQITRELRLGRVLRWPISSRSTLREGLYEYDAIGRAQDAATARRLPGAVGDAGDGPHGAGNAEPSASDVGLGRYLRLGPLGTALLPYTLPRVLLIDELDKSDIDLPNDLLDVFEEGEYEITELARVSAREPVVTVHTADPDITADIARGRVRCRAFPIVIITSNGEREFPPAFLRRCLQYTMKVPDETRLADMVASHFAERSDEHTSRLIRTFLEHRRSQGGLAADQLLNAVYLAISGTRDADTDWDRLLDLIWQRLEVAAPE